eukprot:s1254_g13.t1
MSTNVSSFKKSHYIAPCLVGQLRLNRNRLVLALGEVYFNRL